MSFVKTELNNIHSYLDENEKIFAIGCADFEGHSQLLTVTDKRLLINFYNKSKETVFEIPLNDIKGFFVEKGLIFSSLTIKTSECTRKFTAIPKKLAHNIVAAFKMLLPKNMEIPLSIQTKTVHALKLLGRYWRYVFVFLLYSADFLRKTRKLLFKKKIQKKMFH